MNKEKQIFIVQFVLRFLLLSFFISAFYVVYGGKFGIILHSAPTALMTSFVGFGFLLLKGRYPNDWTSSDEVAEFRSLCWKLMWILNIVLFFGHVIVTLGKLNQGDEAIGASVAGGLSGVVVNSVFYLALILSPIRIEKAHEEMIGPKQKLFSRLFSGGMFWTGILFWFVVSLSLTMNAYDYLSGNRAQQNAKSEASSKAYQRAEKYKEEYIAKNCKVLPWEEYRAKNQEFDREELEKLKKEGK